MTTVWLVAILSLTLPSEYQPRSTRTQAFPLPGPPGTKTSEEFRSWIAPGGKELYLFYWTPSARDLGPMAVAAATNGAPNPRVTSQKKRTRARRLRALFGISRITSV